MIAALRPIALAFALLTRLPVPVGDCSEAQRRQASLCFPLVGYALGSVLALGASLLEGLPQALAGVLLCAALAAITGGLHLDGVADVFDAMGGGRGERERALMIMRDSRIGAHGAAALGLVLLAKACAFAALLPMSDVRPWLLFPALARTGAAGLGAWLPPARRDGLGHAFRPRSRWSTLAGVAALGVVPALVFAPEQLAAVAMALLCCIATGAWALRRLGGVTGDVHGAAIELSEIAFLATWLWSP